MGARLSRSRSPGRTGRAASVDDGALGATASGGAACCEDVAAAAGGVAISDPAAAVGWLAGAGAWVTGGIADGGAVRGVSDGAAAIGVGGGVGGVAVACGVGALAAEACGAGGGAVAFAASPFFCGRPAVLSGVRSSRPRLLPTMATAWSVA